MAGGGECALSTSIMRFLKPTKLGVSPEPGLRHDSRGSECVAKTWRYFVSRWRRVAPLPLPLCTLLPRKTLEPGEDMSRADVVVVLAIVCVVMVSN
jgi:hypothetical protein